MAEYKVGDKVLVELRVRMVDFDHDPDLSYMVERDETSGGIWLHHSAIHGLAPKPEADWSKVEFGARVRVSDDDKAWYSARFISWDADALSYPFNALVDDELTPNAFSHCELIEEA